MVVVWEVKAYDSKTDACLFTFCIQNGWIHVCFHLMNGQLAWPSEGIKLDVEIQLSLLLMGLTLPAVALPKLFLEVTVTAGNIEVVCQEAGEQESQESHHHAETDWSTQVMSSISNAAWAAAESAAPPPCHGHVSVSCRMRPLLPGEVSSGATRAPWVLTDKSITLTERSLTRVDSDFSENRSFKTRGELRNLDHLRKVLRETVEEKERISIGHAIGIHRN
eukprot:Skav202982  [mRNA]  locus=scaffold2274:602403:609214:- [translate_table: standard]